MKALWSGSGRVEMMLVGVRGVAGLWGCGGGVQFMLREGEAGLCAEVGEPREESSEEGECTEVLSMWATLLSAIEPSTPLPPPLLLLLLRAAPPEPLLPFLLLEVEVAVTSRELSMLPQVARLCKAGGARRSRPAEAAEEEVE